METIKTVAPTYHPIKVKGPWEFIGVDLMGKFPMTAAGYQYILTATDYFTKWVEAFPLQDKSAVGQVMSHILQVSAVKHYN